jgi:glycosyltransferase involved in cell wall biosynthesis
MGSVPDVRPYLARAAATVVPLRVGGGSRLKICEALAMERPVVSTTVGAEGLDVGEGVVLADEPSAFAEAVASVLADPVGATASARAGRARALATHEWGNIAPLQARVWVEAAARRGRRP